MTLVTFTFLFELWLIGIGIMCLPDVFVSGGRASSFFHQALEDMGKISISTERQLVHQTETALATTLKTKEYTSLRQFTITKISTLFKLSGWHCGGGEGWVHLARYHQVHRPLSERNIHSDLSTAWMCAVCNRTISSLMMNCICGLAKKNRLVMSVQTVRKRNLQSCRFMISMTNAPQYSTGVVCYLPVQSCFW